MSLQDYLTEFLADWTNNLLDIFLVTSLIFGFLTLIRGTRAVQLLRGIGLIALLFATLSALFNLEFNALKWLADKGVAAFLLAIPVIFQPELRRALEQLGSRTSQFVRFFRRTQDSPLVSSISEACQKLSQRRHGALIVIEQDTGLQEYIDTGIYIDAEPSPQLLLTIFNKTTELHDGAIIVRNGRIAAAACIMPLSTSPMADQKMGLRHRAALGISEVSDAVTVVVSEETGQIAVTHNGRILRRKDSERLDMMLQAFLQNRAHTSAIDTPQG